MKKKIFISFAALAVAAVAAWNVYLASAQSNNELSELMLANVEALAECEESIKKKGSEVTVTVCKRKTGIIQGAQGIHCGKDAETSCTFTNYPT
jgi:hypothetical protein